jgi:tRNA(Ile)-lysidine synthase
MQLSDIHYPPAWTGRWARICAAAALDPRQPVLLALSGGADSVFLLHLLCAARERPPLHAVHVNHGLRGAEAERDAQFCAELCRVLDVPLRVRRVQLDAEGPSLEARAREARYRVLLEEAKRLHVRVLLTGHHADDGLETLLMRWVRGSDLAGLAGLREKSERRLEGGERGVLVLRPLISLRRAEIRRSLADAKLTWRDDSSNLDERFTRNRVREVLLPKLDELAGPAGVDNLRQFARAVEDLERELALKTAELTWSRPHGANACRAADDLDLGGVLPRAQLMFLPLALRRRALWRLLVEGTARAPGKKLLDLVLDDLGAGRCARHTLPRGWQLHLRPATLDLEPPAQLLIGGRTRQPWLPFAELHGASRLPRGRDAAWLANRSDPPGGFALPIPGSVSLPDGRRVCAEIVDAAPGAAIPREACTVELDRAAVGDTLIVRWQRAGDRFRPLGAPGSRPLRRFLADEGVPRGERRRVPLVCDATRIVWVGGLRPCDEARVRPETEQRLRLTLLAARSAGTNSLGAIDAPDASARSELRAGEPPARHVQGELWPRT